jgi:hypothetical protein
MKDISLSVQIAELFMRLASAGLAIAQGIFRSGISYKIRSTVKRHQTYSEVILSRPTMLIEVL